jgi:hypothetical protein
MLKRFIKNKKGDISSLIFIIVIVLALALFSIFISYFANQLTTNLKETAAEAGVTDIRVNETMDSMQTNVTDMFDYLWFAIFIGLVIAMIIFSFLVPTHPIFFPIFVIVWVISIVISGPVANIWLNATVNTALNQTAASYGMMNYIMSHLPWFIGVIGALMLVVLYAKRKHDMEGGYVQ